MQISYADFQRILSYIEEDTCTPATRKQVLFGNKVILLKERLALTIIFLATGETMLKERGKRLQLRFNILNIPENKRNVEWMLKQSLKAFKLFQHRFDNISTLFNTLSTFPFNKIERMLKRMLKSFARAFSTDKYMVSLLSC